VTGRLFVDVPSATGGKSHQGRAETEGVGNVGGADGGIELLLATAEATSSCGDTVTAGSVRGAPALIRSPPVWPSTRCHRFLGGRW